MTRSWFSPTTVVSLFAAAIFLHRCQAQTPEFVYYMAYARAGPYLYFNGGYSMTSAGQKAMTPQLVALPLYVSWSVNSPPWKLLTPGDASFHHAGHTAVATSDSQNLVAFLTQPSLAVGKYNIQQDTWRYDPVQTAVNMGPQFRPVLDPVSGGIYIAGSTNMSIYDQGTNTWRTQSIPNNPLTQRVYGGAVYGGAVYNKARYSIMYLGGYIPGVPEQDLYITEYDIGTRSWSIFNATGDVPPRIADFCGVSSEDGNTIAVFGGRIYPIKEPDFFSNLLYLLDVQQRVWTKVPVASMRANTGCQIVGDQFLAWGGASAKDVILLTQPPLVYDLTKKQLVNTYTAPAYYQTTSSPAPTEHPNSKESTSTAPNLGAILGGSLGSALVIALCMALYFYKVLNAKKDKQTDGDGQDSLKRRTQEPQGSAPGPHDPLPSPKDPGTNECRLPGPHEGGLGSQKRIQGPQMLSSESLKYPSPSSLPGPQYAPPPVAANSPSKGYSPPLAFSYYVQESKSQVIPMTSSFIPVNDDSAYSPGVPYPVVMSEAKQLY